MFKVKIVDKASTPQEARIRISKLKLIHTKLKGNLGQGSHTKGRTCNLQANFKFCYEFRTRDELHGV